jgi:hypothetical protein
VRRARGEQQRSEEQWETENVSGEHWGSLLLDGASHLGSQGDKPGAKRLSQREYKCPANAARIHAASCGSNTKTPSAKSSNRVTLPSPLSSLCACERASRAKAAGDLSLWPRGERRVEARSSPERSFRAATSHRVLRRRAARSTTCPLLITTSTERVLRMSSSGFALRIRRAEHEE